MDKVAIEKRIKQEENRIRRVLKGLEKSLLEIVKPLIKNAAFMQVTLENLQSSINENGVTCEYKNGEHQYGTKKTPEAELYNTMIKNYTVTIKTLCDIIPDGQKNEDEILEFLAGRMPGVGGKK